MSILVVVITFLAVEYRRVQSDAILAEPIFNAVMGATGASVLAGALALVALIKLRPGRGSSALLAWTFGGLIIIMTGGIVYVAYALIL
jgi:hypothetical protein